MPFKKRNKRTATMKLATKKRLMEISIYVDYYIYKNRPINLEEAKTLAYEITLYRNQCNNDKHILQVTEKLTRFMKRIIEELTKTSPPNEKVNESYNESINLFSERSVIDGHNHNKIIESRNLVTNIETEDINKHDPLKLSEVIIISDNENEENGNKDAEKSTISYKSTNELSTGCGKLSSMQKNNKCISGNYNSPEGNPRVRFKDINSKSVLSSKITSLNKDNVQYNTTSTTSNNDFKSNKNVEHKQELTLENKEKIFKSRQQMMKPSMCNAGNKDAQKKNNSKITEKSLPNFGFKKLKKDKIINTTTSKKFKSTPNATNKREPKSQTRNKTTNKRNKTLHSTCVGNTASTSFFIQPRCASNSKETQLDIIGNELYLPVKSSVNDPSKTEFTNPDLISTQMNALKIYNEFVVNDLSWIEDIRYVREIDINEFEHTPNNYLETFWESRTLPNCWKDIEFCD